jgi:hypothetical protein
MDAIFLAVNGQQQGPYTVEQVHAGVARGEYTAETLAWHEGLAGWMPLSTLLASAPAVTPLPAVPGASSASMAGTTPGATLPTSYELSFTRDALREVARRQNLLMWALLLAIAGNVCAKLLPLVGILVYLGAVVFEVYALYTLNRALRVKAAWAYCILLFIPLAGIITLYVFSNKATKVLRAHGIPVGFMGGKVDAI